MNQIWIYISMQADHCVFHLRDSRSHGKPLIERNVSISLNTNWRRWRHKWRSTCRGKRLFQTTDLRPCQSASMFTRISLRSFGEDRNYKLHPFVSYGNCSTGAYTAVVYVQLGQTAEKSTKFHRWHKKKA